MGEAARGPERWSYTFMLTVLDPVENAHATAAHTVITAGPVTLEQALDVMVGDWSEPDLPADERLRIVSSRLVQVVCLRR